MNARIVRFLSTLTCLAALLLASGFASAQVLDEPLKRPRLDSTPAPSQPTQPLQSGGVVQQQSRPFYLQGAVVAALCGGAVWAVCRSSRRQ